MKNFWIRFTSATPVFFKKLQAVLGSLVITCGAILLVPNITDTLKYIAENAIITGTVGALIAQFAQENTTPEPKKKKFRV